MKSVRTEPINVNKFHKYGIFGKLLAMWDPEDVNRQNSSGARSMANHRVEE